MNINIVVAHTLEAQPLVQQFSLQKRNDAPAIYEGQNGMRLIVSGEGAQCATDGVNVLQAMNGTDIRAWLNIGIAGHQSLGLGQCLLANKILDRSNSAVFYPSPLAVHEVYVGELHTVQTPELNYPDNVAYDMEAASFFTAATRHATLELAQCLKLISDNAQNSTEKISKELVLDIFQRNKGNIEAVVSKLEETRALYEQNLFVPSALNSIYEQVHLTATQRSQVLRLCQRMLVFGLDEELDELTSKENLSNIDGRSLVAAMNNSLVKAEQGI